jgi:hypothetical protein
MTATENLELVCKIKEFNLQKLLKTRVSWSC